MPCLPLTERINIHRSAVFHGWGIVGARRRVLTHVMPGRHARRDYCCGRNEDIAEKLDALHNAQQIRIIIVYTIALIRYPRVALPSVTGYFIAVFLWSVIIMELLLSLLVGCGISLILFYRK